MLTAASNPKNNVFLVKKKIEITKKWEIFHKTFK